MTEVLHRESSTPGKGLDFVLSDGSLDRHGTKLNPEGWDLRAFKKNPVALFNHGRESGIPIGWWTKVRVEGGKLIATLNMAAAGTSARIDELRSLIEQGILRATSVGFYPTKFGTKEDPYDFMEQELVEASVVSVPSNKNALQIARSLNVSQDTLSIAFVEQDAKGQQERAINGEQAETRRAEKPTHTKDKVMNISQRVAAARSAHEAAIAALNAHLADENATEDQTDDLSAEVEARKADLDKLLRAEKALGRAAAETEEGEAETRGGVKKPAVRRPLGIKLRETKPGDLIVRAAVCQMLSQLEKRDPIAVMQDRYRDHEATDVFVRAAVDPAKTTVSGWAAELVQTETVAFLETLRDRSFYPRLAAAGTNLQFGAGRGSIKVPARSATPSISGSFVAEGAPIPVRRIGVTSATLTPHKMGVISYFTREMATYSTPQIENLLRQEIRADTADTIDTLLIDSTAGSATRPAGLLYGVTPETASTAGGWSAVIEDVDTLAENFDNTGRNVVLLMSRREARKLTVVPAPAGGGQIGVPGELFDGITRIVSPNVPAGTLIMLDAADFATAAGEQPNFSVSEQAVIHAEDTSPAQISEAGTPNAVAAPVISMFQTDSIAIRMLLDITWAMRRTGQVAYMTGVDWTPTTP